MRRITGMSEKNIINNKAQKNLKTGDKYTAEVS
jgi:hypothetical protein